MPRKRIIDPEFWLDDKMAQCDHSTRLFYIGTWNFSDDYGVIEDSAMKLKAQIFPYDVVDVIPMRQKLVDLGKLVPFKAEGKDWLLIKKFLKWQRVEKPSQTRNPSPPRELLVGDESESSNQLVTSEVKLSKEKRREEKLSEVYTSTDYLKNIPLEDLKEFTDRFHVSEKVIQNKAEDLLLYCQSKGKKYKNYKSFLLNALKRDIKPVEKNDKYKLLKNSTTVL